MRQLVRRYCFAVPRLTYALTVGMRSSTHRALLWEIARMMGFTEGAVLLPEMPVASLVDDSRPVVLREPVAADGNVSALELIVLAQLVAGHRPQQLFEIGTFDGRTTLTLAANSPADAVVFTLDLPPDHPTAMSITPAERAFVAKEQSGVRVHGSELSHKVQQLFGDSATFDFGDYWAEFVFVDGSHAREYVMSDSTHARALLRGRPGTIVWHDYGTWEGVTSALNTLHRDDAWFRGMRRVSGTSLVVLRVD